MFVRECAKVDVGSQIMLNRTADARAEKNFYLLMAAIRNESIKRVVRNRLKEQIEEERKNAGQNNRNNQAINAGMNVMADQKGKEKGAASNEHINIGEDYLVTYKEFIQALRSLKNTLYKTLLPRTISF